MKKIIVSEFKICEITCDEPVLYFLQYFSKWQLVKAFLLTQAELKKRCVKENENGAGRRPSGLIH